MERNDFVQDTANIVPKKFRNLDWFSSVWRITTENPAIQKFKLNTNETHVAPFPEELAYRLISLYSNAGDWILDPFCGSGTTSFIALSLDRQTIGCDVEQKYIELAKKRCRGNGAFICKSADNMPEILSNHVQLCITSPPYLNVREYSDNPDNIGNMEQPYPKLKAVFKEIYRVLKPGGWFCLNVANVAERGYLKTFPFDMIYMCKDIGFRFRSSVIWDKGITIREWNVTNREIAENHEYVWVFKK